MYLDVRATKSFVSTSYKPFMLILFYIIYKAVTDAARFGHFIRSTCLSLALIIKYYIKGIVIRSTSGYTYRIMGRIDVVLINIYTHFFSFHEKKRFVLTKNVWNAIFILQHIRQPFLISNLLSPLTNICYLCMYIHTYT